MLKILMCINPEYTRKIISGEKGFEYRKARCSDEVGAIMIYETRPTKKIIGEVEIKAIHEGTPKEIWAKTNEKGGIDAHDYNAYFAFRTKAVAYELGKFTPYEKTLTLEDFGLKMAPQVFHYITEDRQPK